MEALEGASMQQDLGFPALLNASAKGTSLLHMGGSGLLNGGGFARGLLHIPSVRSFDGVSGALIGCYKKRSVNLVTPSISPCPPSPYPAH